MFIILYKRENSFKGRIFGNGRPADVGFTDIKNSDVRLLSLYCKRIIYIILYVHIRKNNTKLLLLLLFVTRLN